MRFTTVETRDRDAIAAAARACETAFVLLRDPGAVPLRGVLDAALARIAPDSGVVGGARRTPDGNRLGWTLAACAGPLRFELVDVVLPPGNGASAAPVAVDVVVPGLVLAARELLLEPLPHDPRAAMLELCARARDARLAVTCAPAFAFDADTEDLDDRASAAAVRAVAERRPELRGAHRLPAAWRRTTIDREVRMPGGFRARVRRAMPPLTVLVHGTGREMTARRARALAPQATARAVADAAGALRDELRVRGDRYVLITSASALPDAAAFGDLVDALESSAAVALAAPSAGALDGACVLIAPGRIPQHVGAPGATLGEALDALVRGARAMRRAVRAPGAVCADVTAPGAAPAMTLVFAASSLPEVLRVTLSAAVECTRPGDAVVAVTAPNAATSRRLLAAYPAVRVLEDAGDPLLSGAVNRAIAAAGTDLVALVADDVLLPTGSLERLRDAFARIPTLGAAFAAVPGAAGGEGVGDVQYAGLPDLRVLAQRRASERARDAEPIDVAVTPAAVLSRSALGAVGGIAPVHGPTRRGIADLVLRLRAAGYAVVRCDDTLVHRFTAEASHNPAAAVDARTPVSAADPARIARGFDPAQRVPLEAGDAVAPAVAASHAIALAVRDADELERAAAFVSAAAKAFDVRSAVRVHLLLDGAVTPAEAAARIRAVLSAGRVPLDESVSVRIERAADPAEWRAALPPDVRVVVAEGHERDAFAGLPRTSAAGIAALLEPALR